ncbi:GTPase-activating protein [Umbelopsis nana]
MRWFCPVTICLISILTPSSVHVVKAGSTPGGVPATVVGAQYSYTTLITSKPSNKDVSTIASVPSYIGQPGSVSRSSPSIDSSKAEHSSPLPPIKNFNAFMKQTDNEWDDALDDVNSNNIPDEEKEPKRDVPVFQKRVHPKSSRPGTPSSIPESSPAEPAMESPIPVVSKQKNANGLKDNITELIKDPSNFLQSCIQDVDKVDAKYTRFKNILSCSNIDLAALRELSWSGIPADFRPMAWQILLGYLPCNSDRRIATLARKRKEYEDGMSAAYARGTAGLDQTLWHQIHIDIPRTNPGIPLYQSEATQMCLERILYLWSIRHPASGYVQGINDLVTPFFHVFLSMYIDDDAETYNVSLLPKEVLSVIEADSFWCLSKLLDGIQDNYTFAQPGIQRQIATLKELTCRIDAPLAMHLQNEGIEFIQFAFRWINCLLMREISLRNTVRMWDTYLAEGSEGFSEFHVYVCASFLATWSVQLKQMDFQDIMIFLQQVPTSNWKEKDIELLLSQAYMWKSLFHNAPNHLKK